MLITSIGFFGMGLILAAFFMIEAGKWKAHSPLYDAFNLAGGLLLVLYAYLLGSWPFLILNIAWSVVALKDFVHTQKHVPRQTHHISHKRKTRQ